MAATNTLALEGRPETLFEPVIKERKAARLITLEEHAVTPFTVPATSKTFETFNATFLAGLKERLGNIDLRVKIMDANNIGAQIISLNQPTAQAFTDVDQATEFCQKANQFVYDNYVVKYPERFFAFATLPTQNGKAAAKELERCVKEYGFVGAMINGFTATTNPEVGLYLDDPQFDALWEVAERLQKPIFIHPRVPLPSNIRVLDDIPTLHGAPYGFARETVEHILRIMFTGVFDRFPGLKICLGHMGEGLSWILPRTDTTFRMYSDGKYLLLSRISFSQNNINRPSMLTVIYRSTRPKEAILLTLLSREHHPQYQWHAENISPDEPYGGNKDIEHYVLG